MPQVDLKPLQPEDALRYFRAKGLATSFAWEDVWQEEHARVFTVAKAMTLDLLTDVFVAIERALSEGQTFQQFRDGLRPLLEDKGWWGRKPLEDPLTGETRDVQLGSNRRLRTIFDVNMRTAHQAGRWERIQETKATLPFLRYSAVQDGRTRLEHRAWDGTILPIDDPWWDSHYPPCGWNCRCTVVQLNAWTLERRGWQVTDKPVAFAPKPYTNPRTGEVIVLERGIDPGWSHNVGKAYLEGVTARPAPPAAGGEDQVPASAQLLDQNAGLDEASATFLAAFDLAPGEARVFEDVAGWPLAIGPGLFLDAAGEPSEPAPGRRRLLALVGQVIREPVEIRWVLQSGRNGQPYVVRRYLGQLSGAAIAVDFSARSWTFTASTIDAFPPALRSAGVRAWVADAA